MPAMLQVNTVLWAFLGQAPVGTRLFGHGSAPISWQESELKTYLAVLHAGSLIALRTQTSAI